MPWYCFIKYTFFFVLSVSFWNIQFGAISNFRPTNSASSRENLRNCVHFISPPLNLQDDILFIFGSISSISDSRNISASLCSARMLIKYSKPNAVRARRNASMRDFPDFVEIYPYASIQFSQTFNSFQYLSDHIWGWLFFGRIFRL